MLSKRFISCLLHDDLAAALQTRCKFTSPSASSGSPGERTPLPASRSGQRPRELYVAVKNPNTIANTKNRQPAPRIFDDSFERRPYEPIDSNDEGNRDRNIKFVSYMRDPKDLRSEVESRTIAVFQLNWITGNDQLYAHFERFGQITSIFHPYDTETGFSKGHAFIRYHYYEGALEALAHPEHIIDNHKLRVQPSGTTSQMYGDFLKRRLVANYIKWKQTLEPGCAPRIFAAKRRHVKNPPKMDAASLHDPRLPRLVSKPPVKSKQRI